MDCRALLEERLAQRRSALLDAKTTLRHFALINYAVPAERLARRIPLDRFEIPEFPTAQGPRALLSVVPFLDVDFHFPRLAPPLKFTFYQTNHRAYVVEKGSGRHVVWFFGTNLGSPVVHISRTLWKIPWHYTRYDVDCRYDAGAGRYTRYRYAFRSKWCDGDIRLRDSGQPLALAPGFRALDQMKLILTHPVRGYYRRLDGRLGTYQVWHKVMECTSAAAESLRFSLYEDLGIMTPQEMQRPHSIFLCPGIGFEIQLPPQPL